MPFIASRNAFAILSMSGFFAGLLQSFGASTVREAPIPEFSTFKLSPGGLPTGDIKEGVLDVLAWRHTFGETLLDISVRHPGAAQVKAIASRVPGHAAACAERRKK